MTAAVLAPAEHHFVLLGAGLGPRLRAADLAPN